MQHPKLCETKRSTHKSYIRQFLSCIKNFRNWSTPYGVCIFVSAVCIMKFIIRFCILHTYFRCLQIPDCQQCRRHTPARPTYTRNQSERVQCLSDRTHKTRLTWRYPALRAVNIRRVSACSTQKLSLQYSKKREAHAARRKNAGGVSRSANDHASCKQAKCVLSSCHHSHWFSDALIVDDLDGRLVACQSVNT